MTRLAIDTSAIVARAYFLEAGKAHGAPPLAKTTARLYDMVSRLLDTLRPTQALAALDGAGETWRRFLYEGYKANRKAKPEGFTALLGEAEGLFASLGIVSAGWPANEADDVIASLVAQHNNVTIVSSDKDFYQIFGRNGSRQWDPKKTEPDAMPGQATGRFVHRNDVAEKFGVHFPANLDSPEAEDARFKVLHVQALAGDAVDGVPGCPGVGLKGAIGLVETFGSLPDALDAAATGHTFPRALRRYVKALVEGADAAQLSLQLVELSTNRVVDVPPLRPFDGALVRRLVARWGWPLEAS